MAEMMMFDNAGTFNQGYANGLAGLAFNSQGAERQSALAKLAGVDAGAAFKLKAEFDDQDKADFAEFSKVMLSVPDDIKPQVYAKGVQRFGAKFSAMGFEPPQDYTQVMPLFQQAAGSLAGDTRWIQTVDENNQPVWAAATNQGITPTQHRIPDSYKFDVDPATGLEYRYGAKTGTREALGGAQPVASVNPRQFFNGIANAFGAQITSVDRTPEHNRKVSGVNNSYHLSGQAADFVVPPQAKAQFIRAAQQNGYEAIDEGDHIHLEPQGQRGGGYVGMSAAEKARAEAQAKADVALGMEPAIEGAKAEAKAGVELATAPSIEGAKTGAKIGAEADAKRKSEAPMAMQKSLQLFQLIDKAIKHPGRKAATGASAVLPWDYAAGTDAKDFLTVQKQLEGKAFLEAFESLKGGGQITEIEGTKATQAMARLDRAQSEEEYVAALNELKAIAALAYKRAKDAMNGKQTQTPSAPANGWSYGGVK